MPDVRGKDIGTLLLLDLDGVLVTEGSGDTQIGSEIICVHWNLLEQLQSLNLPVAVLTHRSRGEAQQIIRALGLSNYPFIAVYTANDIFMSGLKHKGISFLLKNGSRKSIILDQIEKSFNITADNVAFIDDRACNVEDLLEVGLGLGLTVPAAKVVDNARIVSFDLSAAFEQISLWHGNKSQTSTRLVMEPVTFELHTLARSGHVLTRHWNDFYGLTRFAFRSVRQLILNLRSI